MTFGTPRAKTWVEKVRAIKALPLETILSSKELRDVLPADDRIYYGVQLALRSDGSDKDAAIQEILDAIHQSNTSYRKDEHYSRIPLNLLLYIYEHQAFNQYSAEVLQAISEQPDVIYLPEFPAHLVVVDEIWRKLKSHDRRWFVQRIMQDQHLDDRIMLVTAAFRKMSISEAIDISSLVSDSVLLDSDFRNSISLDILLNIFVQRCGDITNGNAVQYVGIINHALMTMDIDAFEKSMYLMPVLIPLSNEPFERIREANQVKQVEFLVNLKRADIKYFWEYLSVDARILAIYYFTSKEEVLFDVNFINSENNSLIRSLMIVNWLLKNQGAYASIFTRIHELLQQYIIDNAWAEGEIPGLNKLLPHCLPKIVKYCEARPTFVEETYDRKYVFCPRIASHKCIILTYYSYIPANHLKIGMGARAFAELNRDWSDWSLLELFDKAHVVPSLPDLREPTGYVQKISGWINRLLRLREKLHCSKCNQLMKPNVAYAKFMAKFNVTVVTCRRGGDHDTNIYLNECWNCHELIDSRESRFRRNGYYFCIKCGAGPRYGENYAIGSLCPSCGHEPMNKSALHNERTAYRFICSSCGHEIRRAEYTRNSM